MSQNADPPGPALDVTTERVARILADIPYARQIGAYLHDFGDGQGIVLRLPFLKRLVGNPRLPAFHGGVIGSFMQIAALATTFVELGDARPPRLINFSIDFLSHAGPSDLFARCRLERVGRRVAAVSIRCWQGDESTPVAIARAHVYIERLAPDHSVPDIPNRCDL